MRDRQSDQVAGTAVLRSTSARRRRGVSLIHILAVTAVFALLSAILFPRFAATSPDSIGVIESASAMYGQSVAAQSSVGADMLLRHTFFFSHRIAKRASRNISNQTHSARDAHSA